MKNLINEIDNNLKEMDMLFHSYCNFIIWKDNGNWEVLSFDKLSDIKNTQEIKDILNADKNASIIEGDYYECDSTRLAYKYWYKTECNSDFEECLIKAKKDYLTAEYNNEFGLLSRCLKNV